MKISKDSLTDTFVCFIVILLTLFVGRYYTEGDQNHYIQAYEDIKDSSLYYGFWVYRSHITTLEPIHYVISWFFSSIMGIDKLLSMSLSNGLLAFLFIRFVRHIGGFPFVSYIIVLTNYYFFVVYFTAERLKFAFIFLLLALLVSAHSKLRYLFFSLSILSHMQMLIFVVAGAFERVLLELAVVFKRFRLNKSLLLYLGVMLIFVGLFYYVFGDYLLWKVPQYIRTMSLGSLWQTSLFMLLTLLYSKRKVLALLYFMPILLASLIVGPERIVIIAYFVFFYHAVQYKRGGNFGIIISTIYFSFKSIEFIDNIFSTGQGFSALPPD